MIIGQFNTVNCVFRYENTFMGSERSLALHRRLRRAGVPLKPYMEGLLPHTGYGALDVVDYCIRVARLEQAIRGRLKIKWSLDGYEEANGNRQAKKQ